MLNVKVAAATCGVALAATVALTACDSSSDRDAQCNNEGGSIFMVYSPTNPESMMKAGASDIILGEAYDTKRVRTEDNITGTQFKIRQSASLLGGIPDQSGTFEVFGAVDCPVSGFPTINEGYSGAFFFQPGNPGSKTKKEVMGVVFVPAADVRAYAENPRQVVPASIATILAAAKKK